MNKEIQDKLDEFITSFLEVKEVKQFLILKDEVKRSQKDMALSLGTSLYKEKKAYYLSKKREYESHPLIVNYEMLKEEVDYLLNELVNKLKA